MKSLIVLLVLLVSSNALFAQTAKQKPKTASTDKAQQTIYNCPMHPSEVNSSPGKCAQCNMDLTASQKAPMKTYTCPMHQEEKSTKAGSCSKCGKDLIEMKTLKKEKKKA